MAASIVLLDYLVIDDDEIFRKRVVRALDERGFSAKGASNVEEGRTALRTQTARRIVVDLKMPGEGGLALLESLPFLAPNAEAVVLTGYGSIATAMKALRLGARNYLQKPASVDQILAAFESEPASVETTLPVPSLEQVEWDHIQRVMEDCNGNVSQAANVLGMHRRSLQRKLQKLPGTLR